MNLAFEQEQQQRQNRHHQQRQQSNQIDHHNHAQIVGTTNTVGGQGEEVIDQSLQVELNNMFTTTAVANNDSHNLQQSHQQKQHVTNSSKRRRLDEGQVHQQMHQYQHANDDIQMENGIQVATFNPGVHHINHYHQQMKGMNAIQMNVTNHGNSNDNNNGNNTQHINNSANNNAHANNSTNNGMAPAPTPIYATPIQMNMVQQQHQQIIPNQTYLAQPMFVNHIPVPVNVHPSVPVPAPAPMANNNDNATHVSTDIAIATITTTNHNATTPPTTANSNTNTTDPCIPQPLTTWKNDAVSDARQKMNALIQHQQQANDELRLSFENIERAQNRVDMAKKGVETINASVQQGTEELADALLQEPTHWNAMYHKLAAYNEQHGNVDVKRNLIALEKKYSKEANDIAVAYAAAEVNGGTIDGDDGLDSGWSAEMKEIDPDLIKLGSWIGKVRLEARKQNRQPDIIEPYKIIALNRLGFNWDPRENYWMERFDEVKAFLEKNEEAKHQMPNRKTPLGVWCDGQVLEYNKFKAGLKPCYTSKDRIDMLTSVGFVWDRQMAAWMTHYNKLKRLHENYGHCDVSGNHKDKTLLRWIGKQKKKYSNFKEGKKPALTEAQINFLEEVHFFDPPGSKRISSRRGNRKQSYSRGRGRPKNITLVPAEAQTAMAKDTESTKSINGNLHAAPDGDNSTAAAVDARSLPHLGENDHFNDDLESVMMNSVLNGENQNLNEGREKDEQMVAQESADENGNDFNESKIPGDDEESFPIEDDEISIRMIHL